MPHVLLVHFHSCMMLYCMNISLNLYNFHSFILLMFSWWLTNSLSILCLLKSKLMSTFFVLLLRSFFLFLHLTYPFLVKKCWYLSHDCELIKLHSFNGFFHHIILSYFVHVCSTFLVNLSLSHLPLLVLNSMYFPNILDNVLLL